MKKEEIHPDWSTPQLFLMKNFITYVECKQQQREPRYSSLRVSDGGDVTLPSFRRQSSLRRQQGRAR